MYVLLLTIPLWAIVSIPFIIAFGLSNYIQGILNVIDYKIFILLILGIAIHELLHAFTWMLLKKEWLTNIKFGFSIKYLTPYIHYTKPMKAWKYRWGGIMPGLVMGFIPAAYSYFTQNGSINFVGFLFLWAAMGDFISLWMIRKLNKNQMVQDHPDKLGVIVLNR